MNGGTVVRGFLRDGVVCVNEDFATGTSVELRQTVLEETAHYLTGLQRRNTGSARLGLQTRCANGDGDEAGLTKPFVPRHEWLFSMGLLSISSVCFLRKENAMGLTIHYGLTSRTRSTAKAEALVEQMRQLALDLPFVTVDEQVRYLGPEVCQRPLDDLRK